MNLLVAGRVVGLTARFGVTATLTAGIVATLVGIGWLSALDTGSGYWTAVAPAMIAIGVGTALAYVPMTTAGLAGVAAQDAGAASGLINTFHQLGSALGLGVLVAASVHAGTGVGPAPEALSATVRTALQTAALILLIALIGTLVLMAPTETTRRRKQAAAQPMEEPHDDLSRRTRAH
ncbi:hypothetical protein AB0M47_39405 [Hamadaea sp. NPDC051192]|uniref:hypothetical protein n=1 Tax=Hamadaea sp. NPDC051192 TaxID=3154940 RepID=UPI00344A56D1